MTNQLNDHLAKVLGLTGNNTPTSNSPFPMANLVPVQSRPPVAKPNTGIVLADDANYARDNLYDVVEKAQEAINELMEVAKQSQHPRSFEVLNMLLRTQADVSHQLIKLEKERQEAAAAQTSPLSGSGNTYIANAVFVGTNADLLNLFDGKNTDGSTADLTE
jgi:Terminase DNA packaging enzyme